ncbi:MAG: RNA polymerase sigma-70 factor [Lunatimonas sp.]|nr:RNA polymerase sigma-70 factor [Lunatimonas sp.]
MLDEQAFEASFKAHFGALHAYATTILKDSEAAEEVVQTVFLKLWEKRTELQITVSVKSYLYKSVYYDSLNVLKHQKVRQRHMENSLQDQKNSLSSGPYGQTPGQESELMQRIQAVLDDLPEKCRYVFHLSRFEELKYHEIAERLDISIKTVEAHMGKALKSLRMGLREFLPTLLLVLNALAILWKL